MGARRDPLLRVGLLAFAFVLAALPASADAPADQYEPFTEDSLTIRDKHTKLRWQRRAGATPRKFAEAVTDCNTTTLQGGPYRLPTVKELLTLVDEEPHQDYVDGKNFAVMIDDPAFPNTLVSKAFWSQSMVSSNEVWTVQFGTGEMSKADPGDDERFVRCVVYEP